MYATFILEEGNPLMLKYYIKGSALLERLRMDKDGVVSFEYLIVAACIVAAVLFAFGGNGAGTIGAALSTGIADIVAALNAAILAA
jgi:pilus assembly protein Flp/PilA